MNDIFDILYKEALKAYKHDEVPVGCIIVDRNNNIISKSHNKRQHNCDCLGHAEIIAIRKANKKIKDWRLDDYTMYVTLEPCEMCKAIINESRIKKVYYISASNFKKGTHNFEISPGNFNKDQENLYISLMKNFFSHKR